MWCKGWFLTVRELSAADSEKMWLQPPDTGCVEKGPFEYQQEVAWYSGVGGRVGGQCGRVL